MQRTRHGARRTPRGASRLVQAVSAWSVKTRRAPSRRCRDARVYGHATTAMHDSEYTPSRGLKSTDGLIDRPADRTANGTTVISQASSMKRTFWRMTARWWWLPRPGTSSACRSKSFRHKKGWLAPWFVLYVLILCIIGDDNGDGDGGDEDDGDDGDDDDDDDGINDDDDDGHDDDGADGGNDVFIFAHFS